MSAAGEGEGALAATLACLRESAAAITEIQVDLCEIAAPVGQEEQRGQAVAQWLRSSGCEVQRDAVGNVIGVRPGVQTGAAVTLSAHLDSVFPPEQAVRVYRPGQPNPYRGGEPVPAGELQGPGIADDAAGLATLIGVARALTVAGVQTRRDLLFVATVGEEGRGDLKGARFFFSEGAGRELAAFITIDHPEPEAVVHRAVGSRRYLVEFAGPGGHAWGNFGRYNAALALAAAAQRIGAISAPERSSYNVGRLEGGKAINAIPERAHMEVDLRSESKSGLATLEAAFREAVAGGQAEELKRRGSAEARVTIQPIGERPAGRTAQRSPLVTAAQRALRAEGWRPRLTASSTDANAAMAAGVPAIALGWGGRSGELHSIREFFAPAGRERSLAAIARLLLELAGVA